MYAKIISLAILTLVTSIGFTQLQKNLLHGFDAKTSHRNDVKPFPIFIQPAQDYISTFLAQEEQKIWTDFNTFGVTKELVDQYKEKYPVDDRECIETYGDPNKSPSQQTLDLVFPILADFNISSNSINICIYKGSVPAAATDTALMINDALFNELTHDAQTFIISHELQHYLLKDYYHRCLIKKIIQDKEIDWQKIEIYYNNYVRFTEIRADLLAASKNYDYAICYIAAAQSLLKEQGNHGGNTHPSHITRLRLATNVVDYMTKKTA